MTTKAEIAAERDAKQVELRRLKRRETPYLQAAADLGQLDGKIRTLEEEIDATHVEESEVEDAN